MPRGYAFAQPISIASETYRNADRKVRTLRYRTLNGIRGRKLVVSHLVLMDQPELDGPTVLLADCQTVEEAREAWKQARIEMECAGYERINQVRSNQR